MKLAVLGLGFMGSTHLKAIRNISRATLTAVASSDERQLSGDLSGIQGNLGGTGERMDFRGVAKYTRWEDALKDPQVEAVDICLPTALHAPAAIAALEAGKHVLVEKPMALSGADCDRMLAAAQAAGKILMTAQVLRFFPEYQAAAAELKALGTPRSALFRRRCAAPFWTAWIADKAVSGGGVFDLLIHDVDFALHLFGTPQAVSAVGYENLPAGIDWISGHLHYASGLSVLITGGWHHPKAYPFSMEFTLVADGGTLEYSSAGRPLTLYSAAGEEKALNPAAQDGFQAEIEYFLECAAANRQPELCPPAESAAAVKVALALVESRDRNGERIPCQL
jgi:predicted dehydrogenase